MRTAAFLSWIVLGGIAFFCLLLVTIWLYRAKGSLRLLTSRLLAAVVLEALFSTIGLIFVDPGSPFVSWMNATGRGIEIIGVVWFVVGALLFKEKKEPVQ